MAEQHEPIVDAPDAQPLTPEQAEKKRRKKKEKVRSAWISFVGRILAQVIGAAATITLGLMVVQKYHGPAADVIAPSPSPQVVPVRLATPGQPSIAVLPLLNFSAGGDDSFANGMTEALIADLARLSDLRVVSRTSSMQVRQQGRPLPEIARALGVDFVIEGSVIKSDGRVRITAQLIEGRTDEHLWAESYDRPLRGVLSVQSEVAAAIARAVKERIAADRRLSVETVANRH